MTLAEATAAIAATFGADIAHDVCCLYLTKRPALYADPLHWWRRAARYYRREQAAQQRVRVAPR